MWPHFRAFDELFLLSQFGGGKTWGFKDSVG